MTKPFKFKQFEIYQDRCAMKIGTDGVLLGAWTSLMNRPQSILDIGTGTGLLALMLAQRSRAETIDALEIDENAYEQCVGNFEASPWGDRLFCYHAGLDEFTEEIEETYDLIISNPPFHSEEVSSGNVARDLARQNQSLPFEELIDGVSLLLNPNGTFSTIIPFKEERPFLALASHKGLYPERITRVKGTPTSEIKRSLLQFSFTEGNVDMNELIIEKERHQYTDDYIALTQDFYLKM
ncbi:tRNA1(Val) (adenine(37)-N6)-methyltransferase [Maribacter polysaccharolyticus]|uniref:tRNA1(Val) (adenine(37)-N6)-methyltransferase n=1 Tax=Maribacter polysaccharolyticus TaxID=3020831 RepID=UPI00237FB473|nr:methyltransferase [Maribacter polysaccharolyticus]MDE3742504.1 methyltransferase [Maribacter polysaccharolyticus]